MNRDHQKLLFWVGLPANLVLNEVLIQHVGKQHCTQTQLNTQTHPFDLFWSTNSNNFIFLAFCKILHHFGQFWIFFFLIELWSQINRLTDFICL
jgi:hypothetical protein